MSLESNQRLVRRYLEAVLSAVNVDRVVDGHIVEHGGAANVLEPLWTIGAFRVVDSRN